MKLTIIALIILLSILLLKEATMPQSFKAIKQMAHQCHIDTQTSADIICD